MLVVVVFPFVPVTRITLYPEATLVKISLSNFNATLPGKVVPPFKIVLVRNIVNLVAKILIIDLILILLTAYIIYLTLLPKSKEAKQLYFYLIITSIVYHKL